MGAINPYSSIFFPYQIMKMYQTNWFPWAKLICNWCAKLIYNWYLPDNLHALLPGLGCRCPKCLSTSLSFSLRPWPSFLALHGCISDQSHEDGGGGGGESVALVSADNQPAPEPGARRRGEADGVHNHNRLKRLSRNNNKGGTKYKASTQNPDSRTPIKKCLLTSAMHSRLLL